ncbi:hypothetical protein GCM10027290_18410 [Micromonospora sonneratiae]|uniref:Uncharacterized protein n=1 Tax=Micromonospora sonneratiae TaxID=1184706 RepID=A0ABW3Y852_9ACTN
MTPRPRIGTRGRFGVRSRLDASAIRAAAEANPRLRRFMRAISDQSEAGDRRAGALMEHLLTRVLNDVGEMHMTNVVSRLERIQVLRDNIAAILDNVLEGGELPPTVRVETLGEYFDQLSTEMRELSRPREALLGDEPFRLHDESFAYADDVLREFEGEPAARAAGGQHVPTTDAMIARLDELPPQQRTAVRRAAELDPRRLWRVFEAETEGGQARRLAELETSLGGRMSAAELEQLRAAVTDVRRAGSRAALVSPARLAPALANIHDPHLRSVVLHGDSWIVQQLAMHNLATLETMWRNFRERGGAADGRGFRNYLRHQMVTFGRATPAEFTAAFSLSSIEMFLKSPDDAPMIRGTDMVGIAHDGWVWLVDDKSHRATSVSDVSALTTNLVTNLRDDAAAFRDAINRLRRADPEFVADPRVVDAIMSMRACADDIDRINGTVAAADRPARIRAALQQHRLKLRVTSAMGEVVEISDALRDLGLRPQSTGPVIPLPNPGSR